MNRKNVVILDAFSTVHVGNGILLDQSIAVVNEILNPKKISILSLDPATVKLSKKNVSADIFSDFPRGKSFPKKVIWSLKFFLLMTFWLSSFSGRSLPKSRIYSRHVSDYVEVINSGDVFLSISGETINSTFFPRMVMRCIIMWILGLKGKEVIVFPQSIGPLTKNYHKKMIKFLLKRVKQVYARDVLSFRTAEALFGNKRALLSPDVGVYSSAAYPDLKRSNNRAYSNNQAERLVIGVAVSKPPKEISIPDSLTDDIAKIFCTVFDAKHVDFLILPSNYLKNGMSDDYQECVRLMKRIRYSGFTADILPNEIIEPREYAQHLANVDLFLSTRMHVAILSTSLGVPTIAFKTQEKIYGYMSLVKMEEYVVPVELMAERLSKLLIKLTDAGMRKKCSETLHKENGARVKELLDAIACAG